MAQWVSANLSNIVPSEITSLLDDVSNILTLVSTPLDVVASGLDVAKSFLVGLPPIFPPSNLLRSLIEDFKAEFLASGIYMCNMWDYPAKQLEFTSFGPDNTYQTRPFSGGTFQDTFLSALNSSFDDQNDVLRPQFSGSVAMAVLVTHAVNLQDLGITLEEDFYGFAFDGLERPIADAAFALQDIRWNSSWGKIRQIAEAQPNDKVAARVARVTETYKIFSSLSREEKDAIPIPFNPDTGAEFLEGEVPTGISWEDQILPVIEAVEDISDPPRYPTWSRVALVDVYPQLVDVVNSVLDPVIDLLQVGGTIKDTIVGLIEAIQAKIIELQNIIDDIENILELLDRLLRTTGLFALFVSSDEGIAGLRSKLTTATNVPGGATGGFFAGMAILAGAANVDIFSALFSPIGFS